MKRMFLWVVVGSCLVLSYLAGALATFLVTRSDVNNIFTVVLAFIPPLLTILQSFLLGYMRDCDKAEEKKKFDSRYGRIITRKNSSGDYTIDVGDVYEAVEKLGYIEHDMNSQD